MIVNTAPEIYKEGDFFQKKRMKDIFCEVLEFMLTLDKMLNINTLMCKSSKSVGIAFWKLFKMVEA